MAEACFANPRLGLLKEIDHPYKGRVRTLVMAICRLILRPAPGGQSLPGAGKPYRLVAGDGKRRLPASSARGVAVAASCVSFFPDGLHLTHTRSSMTAVNRSIALIGYSFTLPFVRGTAYGAYYCFFYCYRCLSSFPVQLTFDRIPFNLPLPAAFMALLFPFNLPRYCSGLFFSFPEPETDLT